MARKNGFHNDTGGQPKTTTYKYKQLGQIKCQVSLWYSIAALKLDNHKMKLLIKSQQWAYAPKIHYYIEIEETKLIYD